MTKEHWISRKRVSLKMARGAANSEARLIHYDLPGRYSIKAAQCAEPRDDTGIADGMAQRPVLHLPGEAQRVTAPLDSRTMRATRTPGFGEQG